ncbi:MAG: type II/IV secretion system protein [Candidatus Sumerlaeia bacterium]|nr:type II/IV secretion system protein [Candidatus Sumerlaeia bacterium]
MGPLQQMIEALPNRDDWAVAVADAILRHAVAVGASDVHVQPRSTGLAVRGRVDGRLCPFVDLPSERQDHLLARFKVMARLPAYVQNKPQDGRVDWRPEPGAVPVMVRVSFLPTILGESLVLRFPHDSKGPETLEALGMPPAVLEGVQALLQAMEGAVLLTGSSGSGKTTTLYAMLRRLNDLRPDRMNLVTIEDPVERVLGFASQVQVNEAQGLTFEETLRATLRHDPNVLLIGEIRDPATARIAIQAAMTGHLLLSTLHAGRASWVISRLLSMGIEPYLVGSALSGAVAQRLVRRLCPDCREYDSVGGTWRSRGCEACRFTGHRGRVGLFELLTITEPIREIILASRTTQAVVNEARTRQPVTLESEGQRLMLEGTISRLEYEEVLSPLETLEGLER